MDSGCCFGNTQLTRMCQCHGLGTAGCAAVPRTECGVVDALTVCFECITFMSVPVHMGPCALSSALCLVQVEVVAAKEHSLQDCLTQMVKADLLVASISSFSDVVGLLGGMMVVYPRCHSEHQPLPGWHVVSCDANPNLDRMCWPPTRFSAEGRRKRMEVGGCTAREPSSRNRTRWTFVDLPKFKPRLEEQIFGGMPLSPQQAQQEGSSVIKTFKKSLQTYPVTILGLWLALNVMVAIRVVSYAQKRYG